MKKKKPSTSIRTVHKNRKQLTRARVMKAINILENEGEYITFASVADAAGVTRATLYNHPDLKKLISEKRSSRHNAARRYKSTVSYLKKENLKLKKKVENQRSWIEVLNDTGPVVRDEDLVTKLN